jgi:hypothetical protein
MAIISSNFIKDMQATNGGQANAQAPQINPTTLRFLILPNSNFFIGYHVNPPGGGTGFGFPV